MDREYFLYKNEYSTFRNVRGLSRYQKGYVA